MPIERREFTDQSILDLVGMIYDAALAGQTWHGVLRTAGELVGTDKLCICAYDGDTGIHGMCENVGYDLAPFLAHEEELLDIDPRTAHLYRQDAGVLCVGSRYMPFDELARTDAFHELYKPVHIRDTAEIILFRDGASHAFFGAYSRLGDGDFSAVQSEIFLNIASHLKRALQVRTVIASRPGAETDVLENARSDAAVFALDRNGAVLKMNETAHACVAGASPLRIVHSTLSHRFPADNRLLDKTIGEVLKAVDGQRPHVGSDIRLRSESPGVCLSVSIAPLFEPLSVIQEMLGVSAKIAGAVASVRECVDPWLSPSSLADAYCLTPSEAAIAADLIRGQKVVSIAASRGVTGNAVRFHLKNIFSKLEVRSQGELIAKLLNGG